MTMNTTGNETMDDVATEQPTSSTDIGTDVSAGEQPGDGPNPAGNVVFELSDVNVYYGSFRAVRDVDLQIREQ